ncbi:elongation factor P [candidate division WWE3 bacterium RIFOXYC1_FULL_40_10]|uniref:Elongation factor P n=1 Tax=candidate division WWE3 bacterium RIFOXYA2_FULL_46_9 TaxID=1802636 RepID=A0A1F4W1T2_UNCKA|nr:MAG: elongation factor P [candidate division WWE3 bacterium RIFOXYB1_FULL_40_22]OGC62189.1 MAG: elongation factor P [candidate division WWE3 bacterium RIFOXYA1_FULL_40_11]OGC63379.1 MAG: elongation factor P [candidate division WWE3 bacterium RIFOXYA2_FULL_46_9]OGC64447.1 MAG: elongation factor P [candidate division WWE3 bacterium RIFOXYB2_FULL_41_6]OGC66572.1 MAG: elongation factor P [candidate division WWE3 bacterium RIFOXYC1_FULL_40_10]OGC67366.1 MAG: elongation factor P [candidate divisi
MNVTDLKNGTIYQENGQPLLVVKYEHIKVSRGGATVKVKVKNLLTGQVLEKSYVASGHVERADVYRKNAQYLYKEGENYYFMDPDSFEQFFVDKEVMGDSYRFLVEGQKVQALYFNGNAVSMELPISMIFEVSYTEPGYKGNTVSNVLKSATLDNGAEVRVPIFIKIGDKVKIDTRDGSYVSKA